MEDLENRIGEIEKRLAALEQRQAPQKNVDYDEVLGAIRKAEREFHEMLQSELGINVHSKDS